MVIVNDLYLQYCTIITNTIIHGLLCCYNKISFYKINFWNSIFITIQGNYEGVYVKRIHSLKEVSLSEVIHSKSKEEVQVRYSNLKEFKAFAKHLKIMSDSRVSWYKYLGLCRAFVGISLRCHFVQVYLVLV